MHSKSTALKFIKLGDVLLRVRLKYFYAHAPHRCGGAERERRQIGYRAAGGRRLTAAPTARDDRGSR